MRDYPSFNYRVAGPEGAPWITFIPGIGNDGSFWAQQAEALAGEFQVLTFDPWGHGDSPAPPEKCGFDDTVAGIVGLWDALRIKRSSIVGLGFGGSTALALGLKYPERIQQVVACACRPRQPDNRRDFWRDRMQKAQNGGLEKLGDITVDRWLSEEFRHAHPEVDQRLRAMIKRTTPDGYCAYVGSFIEMDFEADLEKLSVPVVLVAAEFDHGGGPVEDMVAMSKRIPGAQLEVVQGSGHIVNHEKPEEVTNILRRHLLQSGKNSGQ